MVGNNFKKWISIPSWVIDQCILSCIFGKCVLIQVLFSSIFCFCCPWPPYDSIVVLLDISYVFAHFTEKGWADHMFPGWCQLPLSKDVNPISQLRMSVYNTRIQLPWFHLTVAISVFLINSLQLSFMPYKQLNSSLKNSITSYQKYHIANVQHVSLDVAFGSE